MSNQTNQIAVKEKLDLKPVRRSRDEVAISMSRDKNDLVYVNRGFVNSVSSINQQTSVIVAPPTSVVREQYCVCAQWPKTQKVLAVAVGLLLGALIGLSVSYALRIGPEETVIGSIFRQQSKA